MQTTTSPNISGNVQTKKFITFGGPSEVFHKNVKRICDEAKNIDFFDEIVPFTEKDLQGDVEFWNKHGNFIENNKRGYGYWLWKPFLIKKELDKLNENDILIYCDCGCEINSNGKPRLREYIDLLNHTENEYGLISFELEMPNCVERKWTKRKIFEYFDCTEIMKDSAQCVGGTQIIKKNKHSTDIINNWYNIACNYDLLNDMRSDNEDCQFVENRHDQSIYSMLAKKYGSIKIKDETWAHNWSDCDHFPFLTKRLR